MSAEQHQQLGSSQTSGEAKKKFQQVAPRSSAKKSTFKSPRSTISISKNLPLVHGKHKAKGQRDSSLSGPRGSNHSRKSSGSFDGKDSNPKKSIQNQRLSLESSGHQSSSSLLFSPRALIKRISLTGSNLRSRSRSSSSSDSSLNSSSRSITGAVRISKQVYRFARKCMWNECSKILREQEAISSTPSSSSEFVAQPPLCSYVYRKDGTTSLHLAVMSRTGYLNTFKHGKHEFTAAPLQLIEQLLKDNPQSAEVRCTLNGYTPVIYACLCCSATDYKLEDAAAILDLFVQFAPNSLAILSSDGLSPIDIHIVSYSHYHKAKEDTSGRGNTTTHVLRLLLANNPEQANLRVRDRKVVGPIEFLYRCHASAFSEAVLNEMYDSDEDGTVMSEFTIPERRQHVVETVSNWWIWSWAVLIFKYGSMKVKRKGFKFAAVHTASLQVGCPTNILSICLYAFPRQVKTIIEDCNATRNLPLHAVCSWPSHHDNGEYSKDGTVSRRKCLAISRLLEEAPEAITVLNNLEETPLELALRSGTTWNGGVRRLVKLYPQALCRPSKQTGLFPFMMAAAAAPAGNVSTEADKHGEIEILSTIYCCLRSNKKAIAQCFDNDRIE